eukprot:10946981-Alexandrium_andersonii.AAC.1
MSWARDPQCLCEATGRGMKGAQTGALGEKGRGDWKAQREPRYEKQIFLIGGLWTDRRSDGRSERTNLG